MARNEMSKPFDRKKPSRNERPTFAESMANIVGVLGVCMCICFLVLGATLAVTEIKPLDVPPDITEAIFPFVLIIIAAMQCFITGLLFLGMGRALHYLRRIAAGSENN